MTRLLRSSSYFVLAIATVIAIATTATAQTPITCDEQETAPSGVGFTRQLQYNITHGALYSLTGTQKFIKYNNPKIDLTDTTVTTLLSGESAGIDQVFSTSKNKIYITFQASAIRVAEVDPVTMVASDVINDTTFDYQQHGPGPGVATDESFLYFITYGDPVSSWVVKYSLSDFSFVSSRELVGLTRGSKVRYDSDSGFIFGDFIIDSEPGGIVRINPSDLSYVAVRFVEGPLVPGGNIAFTAGLGWVGNENTPNVFKFNKSDLAITQVGTSINEPPTIGGINNTYFSSNFIWTIGFFPSTMERIDPSSLISQNYTFSTNLANGLAFDDSVNGYVAFNTNPQKICRFALPLIIAPTATPTQTPTRTNTLLVGMPTPTATATPIKTPTVTNLGMLTHSFTCDRAQLPDHPCTTHEMIGNFVGHKSVYLELQPNDGQTFVKLMCRSVYPDGAITDVLNAGSSIDQDVDGINHTTIVEFDNRCESLMLEIVRCDDNDNGCGMVKYSWVRSDDGTGVEKAVVVRQ